MNFIDLKEKVDAVISTGNNNIRREVFTLLNERFSMVGTCQNPLSKRPIEKGWTRYCIVKNETLPDGNLAMGIAAGPISGLFLDVDNPEMFAKYCADNHIQFDENTTTIKSGKGFHYYYQYPQDGFVYGCKGGLKCVFDIRGVNGMIMCPGSMHPSGAVYQIVNPVEPAPAPEWLKDLCREIDNPATQGTPCNSFYDENRLLFQKPSNPIDLSTLEDGELREDIQKEYEKGSRSDALARILFLLIYEGYSKERIFDTLILYPIGARIIEKGQKYFDYEYERANRALESVGAKKKKRPSEAKINYAENLLAILKDFEYVTVDGKSYYAKCASGNHFEYIEVESEDFLGIVLNLHRDQYKVIPDLKFYKPAYNIHKSQLKAIAKPIKLVQRFGVVDGNLYLNLGSADNKAIKISPTGYEYAYSDNVFLKSLSTNKQIDQVALNRTGLGATDKFLEYLGFTDKQEKAYLIITLLSYLHPDISSPFLYFFGPEHSGKTSTAIALKNVFDPAPAGFSIQDKMRDLALTLANTGIGFFDNFTGLKKSVQDSLCLAYSNGIYSAKKNYSDDETIETEMKCPLILCSVSVPTNLASDFLSRVTFFKKDAPEKYIPELELKKNLADLYPLVRGELCNLMSKLIGSMGKYEASNLTRHADFDVLGQAFYEAIGGDSSRYLKLVEWKIRNDSMIALEDVSLKTFFEFIRQVGFQFFFPSEMCSLIAELQDSDTQENFQSFGKKLNNKASLLANLGVHVFKGTRHKEGRLYFAVTTEYASANGIDLESFSDEKVVTDCYKRYLEQQAESAVNEKLSSQS